jgi:hypothetical protein
MVDKSYKLRDRGGDSDGNSGGERAVTSGGRELERAGVTLGGRWGGGHMLL